LALYPFCVSHISENPGFVIKQDQSQDECPYCFCKPCFTNEQNRQLWWHANIEEPHLWNSGPTYIREYSWIGKPTTLVLQGTLHTLALYPFCASHISAF
jgi:hypothetical protein